ncbi:MAG: cupin domain-containing protein [Methanoregula sp.]|jgi:quercetin dioxygenase-like cupin family protein|nr:cupin domain-containing protein [Methanoregula sp.]
MKTPQPSGRHGTVIVPGRTVEPESLPWNPHPKFAGVSLRHLVTGKDTVGLVSLHHVRIDPGCAIGDHIHAGMVEIHDVLTGEGTCTLEGSAISYTPGVVGVMPADQVHRVEAGDNGILLLATFSPPLV